MCMNNFYHSLFKSFNCFFLCAVLPAYLLFLIHVNEYGYTLVDERHVKYWMSYTMTLMLMYILTIVLFRSVLLSTEQKSKMKRKPAFWKKIFRSPFALLGTIVFCLLVFISQNESQANGPGKMHRLIKEIPLISQLPHLACSLWLSTHLSKSVMKYSLQKRQMDLKQQKLVIHQKGGYGFLPVKEVALIFQLTAVNWLMTFKEEKHISDLSLSALYECLDKRTFFQVNRRCIVNRHAIQCYSQGTFGKIELRFHSDIHPIVTVSKGRACEFRKWLMIREVNLE